MPHFTDDDDPTLILWSPPLPPPMTPQVLSAMHFAASRGHNPSSTHGPGQASRRAVMKVAKDVAARRGLEGHQVVWCSSSEEATALALLGRLSQLTHPKILMLGLGDDSVWHKRLRQAIRARQGRVFHTMTPKCDPSWLACDLWVIPAACPLTGPLPELKALIATAAQRGIWLHVERAAHHDVVMTTSSEREKMSLTLDGQGVGGPSGIAALIAPKKPLLSPLWGGGGQQEGQRPGTLARDLVAGFGVAVAQASSEASHTHFRHFTALPLGRARQIAVALREEGFVAGFGQGLGVGMGLGVGPGTRRKEEISAAVERIQAAYP